MIVDVDVKSIDWRSIRVGSVVKVRNGERHILANITEVAPGHNGRGGHMLLADLLGELHRAPQHFIRDRAHLILNHFCHNPN